MDNLRLGDWLKAREIIALALQQWFPPLSQERAYQLADAIQARLAGAEPPLVVCDINWAYEGKPQ